MPTPDTRDSTDWLINWLTDWLTDNLIDWLIDLFIIQLFIYLFFNHFVYSFIHSIIHLFIHVFIHSFIHSFTHRFTDSVAYLFYIRLFTILSFLFHVFRYLFANPIVTNDYAVDFTMKSSMTLSCLGTSQIQSAWMHCKSWQNPTENITSKLIRKNRILNKSKTVYISRAKPLSLTKT